LIRKPSYRRIRRLLPEVERKEKEVKIEKIMEQIETTVKKDIIK